MKKLALLLIGFSFTFSAISQEGTETHSDEGKQLPSVILMDMEGNEVNTAELGFDGPVIFSFWATWCSPCKKELNTIHEMYTDWQDDTGVTLVAVSVDDERTRNSVPVYVNGKAWEFQVIMDPNGDFKRAMGVNNVPHTFLVDVDGNIVYSHNNYATGDEITLRNELYTLVGLPIPK